MSAKMILSRLDVRNIPFWNQVSYGTNNCCLWHRIPAGDFIVVSCQVQTNSVDWGQHRVLIGMTDIEMWTQQQIVTGD